MANQSSVEVLDSHCHVWPLSYAQVLNEDDRSGSSPCTIMFIDVRAVLARVPDPDSYMDIEEEEELSSMLSGLDDCAKMVVEDTLDARYEEITPEYVSDMLVNLLLVPAQPFMVEQIMEKARLVYKAHESMSRKILSMEVYIELFVNEFPTFRNEEEDDEETIKKVLKKVKTEVSRTCAICLEEMALGYETSCLPCSHPYHEGCVLKWLKKRRVCPLCRFDLP